MKNMRQSNGVLAQKRRSLFVLCISTIAIPSLSWAAAEQDYHEQALLQRCSQHLEDCADPRWAQSETILEISDTSSIAAYYGLRELLVEYKNPKTNRVMTRRDYCSNDGKKYYKAIGFYENKDKCGDEDEQIQVFLTRRLEKSGPYEIWRVKYWEPLESEFGDVCGFQGIELPKKAVHKIKF
jgi:hypothetical protein